MMRKYFSKQLFTARNIAYLAVLVALVAVLQAVGGVIKLGVVSLNFTLIPIVLGAMLLGPVSGGILGLVCGIIITVQVATGTDLFYVVIFTNSPVITVLTCLLKTTVAGFVAGLVYRLLVHKNRYVAVFVAAGLVPLINTVLFILGCLMMSGTIGIFQSEIGDASNVFVFIVVVIVTWNFFIEFALNMLVSPALCRVVQIVEKSLKRKIRQKRGNNEPVQAHINTESDSQISDSQTEQNQ